MSAPAALAVAKLGWPERRKVQSIDMDSIQLNVGYIYICLYNKSQGQSKMDHTEKLATYGTEDEDKQNKNTTHMCWTPLCANKHK